ncbi:PQQ-binding-like beta-propeller repeat protein [Natronococcus sp. A-GB7]|uniref:outer membrane protein assembly factor BamB family protein n=1 Tax=Natronococcus sp. A-GB7 TaxID=3037649 RepID=UPI0024202B86|nr:PQQ-binding-like beta-propeller repeat protein [Natronococcus sp. A-GB7]MDG5820304.1 PQQ-binding-like beta-propeller repeat protein [Natronococcus sp. A-GB7]
MTKADAERDEGDGDGRGSAFRRRSLGEIESARSRHMWRRSSVHATDGVVVAGRWDGTVTAFEADSLETRWSVEHPDHAVGIATLEGGDGGTGDDGDRADAVVAGRGEMGTIATYDLETGDCRWRYEAADDVGEPVRESVFAQPYVVALETDGDRLYAATRRYERDGETRRWESTVLAFDSGGTVRWRYDTDASPIVLELNESGERLAVGYNRCQGEHDNGLVVLETDTGDLAWTWDPGTEGDRRVGDVSFDDGCLAVASHGDKRGYLLESGGAERWRVDLATETEIDGERLYAYPNHAYANGGRVAFLTGNTYAAESRETAGRHPNEHRIAVFGEDGRPLWDDSVRGFVHGLATDGSRIVVPCAQNFRDRDPDAHAVRRFDLESGPLEHERLEGIATAAAIEDGTVAAIEEPVTYHDDGRTRGEYALAVGSVAPRE